MLALHEWFVLPTFWSNTLSLSLFSGSVAIPRQHTHATHFNPEDGGRMELRKVGKEAQFHGMPIPKNKINMNTV
jgi:hypothetical protein